MAESIIKSDISKEMRNRYIVYAMDVIEDRALPDVRDGLKPVARRIIYSMHELGLSPDKSYRKCARIVGDVLGKFHPHGDQSVYGALTKLAQPFSLRYLLIDGQGNFGSVDGDSPAAMRYTEAKQTNLQCELLRDISKNTIDFIPNFDGEEMEPSVLPSRFPNLLVNGTFGIAVGMATDIPSHNLNEIIDGIVFLIDNPNSTDDDIINIVKAPDYPTGGEIVNLNDMSEMYKTGRGKIVLRGKHHIETSEENPSIKSIVFTEIPYSVNKSDLCVSISELVNNKDIILKNILDIRDESDREGMRIVIDIKKTTDENKILSRLFEKTRLQDNQKAIFCVLVDSEPKILSLKQMMEHYINFQKEVLTRRTKFELIEVGNRLHILKGLKKSLDNLDLTIHLIRQSKNTNEAKIKLIENLYIDEIQAKAILDLRLQRLTNLDINNILNELIDLNNEYERLSKILSSETNLLKLLIRELIEIKDKYGDKRRTKLIYENTIQTISQEELISEYNTRLFLTKENYLKKIPLTSLRNSDNHKLKDNDLIIKTIDSTNKSDILLFSSLGFVYKLKGYSLTDCKTSTLGEYLPSLLSLEKDENIIGIASVLDYSKGYVLVCYKSGKIAKINLNAYEGNRSKLANSLNLNDEVVNIIQIQDDIDLLLQSSINKILIISTSILDNPKSTRNAQGNQILKSKNDSYMTLCVPISDLDVSKIENLDYYRNNGAGIGTFLKKTDEILLK